jgi:hypothetical protein
MKMILRYRGTAHVREMSSEDILNGYGLHHDSVSVQQREKVAVSKDLGEILIKDPDWELVGIDHEPAPPSEVPEVPEVPEAPNQTASEEKPKPNRR